MEPTSLAAVLTGQMEHLDPGSREYRTRQQVLSHATLPAVPQLVLSHRDLAAKLCEPPLSFTRPERWNGFVPPERLSTGARNDSPYRLAFAAIVAEAMERGAE